jgi:aspartyl-tRNA(Asn)/glutamyl-tRNA(Gln) amidotransferase subunit A
MSGFDPKDSTSSTCRFPIGKRLSSDITGKRIGIPREYRIDGVPAEIDAVWEQGIERLRDAGAEPVECLLPHTKYALPTYYIIAPAEARPTSPAMTASNTACAARRTGGITNMYEATRAAGFGAEVKRRIMIGTYVLSAGFYDAYFNQAQRSAR